MHKTIAGILIMLVLLLGGCQSTTTNNQTTVTYVGNSGFLVTIGDHKILVDGIFPSFPPEYTRPAEVTDLLDNAKPPFDKIDLILATHAHIDHFDAYQVAAYLGNNPDTIFISTPEAATTTLAADNTLSGRVIAINLKRGESKELETNGMRIKAYDISHGFGPNGEPFPNLGFLVETNGVKFFHSGDMDGVFVRVDYLKMIGLPDEQIDIAFIPHYILRKSDGLQLATEGLAARYYVPIHYQWTTPPFDAQLTLRIVPDAILFDQELDTWVMPTEKQ